MLTRTLNVMFCKSQLSILSVSHKLKHAQHVPELVAVVCVVIRQLKLTLSFEPKVLATFQFHDLEPVIWLSLSTDSRKTIVHTILGSVPSRAVSVATISARLFVTCATNMSFGTCAALFGIFLSKI